MGSFNSFFRQQQNAIGSLRNMYSGVFWASWGGSGKEPCSRNRLWVRGTNSGNRIRVLVGSDMQVLRFQKTRFHTPKLRVQKVARPKVRRFRCSMGSGSVPEVWTEPVLGTRFRKPEVLRRSRVPEIPFPRFRKLLFTLKGHFCTLKVCKLKVNFCTRTLKV